MKVRIIIGIPISSITLLLAMGIISRNPYRKSAIAYKMPMIQKIAGEGLIP